MKRSQTEDGGYIEERYSKSRLTNDGSRDTSNNTASPASLSTSPMHNRHVSRHGPNHKRQFVGASQIKEYQFQQKLGEGTFG